MSEIRFPHVSTNGLWCDYCRTAIGNVRGTECGAQAVAELDVREGIVELARRRAAEAAGIQDEDDSTCCLQDFVDEILDLRQKVEDAQILADVMIGRVPDVPWPKEDGDLMPRPLMFVCMMLMNLLEETPKAENYVGWGWEDPKTGKGYNLVIQHAEGISPQVKAAEAVARAEKAEAQVEALKTSLDQAVSAHVLCENMLTAARTARDEAKGERDALEEVLAKFGRATLLSPDTRKENDNG